MVRLRLEPEDEYMHDTEGASNFNESMYFNFYDAEPALGGFVRLGNRPNERYAEQTTCLYLPDGRVGFMFQRPEISNNESFDAGGCERSRSLSPSRSSRFATRASWCCSTSPKQMAIPARRSGTTPAVEVSRRSHYRGCPPCTAASPWTTTGSRSWTGERVREGALRAARGCARRVRVGDDHWEVDGYGLRDHSWGPRFWQAPWWYRWLTGNCGEDFGFMLSIIAGRDGRRRRGGIVFSDGAYRDVLECTVETGWRGEDSYHQTITALARTDEREYRITGQVLSLIPLRNRRRTPEGEQLITRISEGMTEWQVEGVGVGYGLSEYLDQIVDGAPVGVAEDDGA